MYFPALFTLLLTVHHTIAANPPAPNAQIQQVNLPTGLADDLFNSSVAVNLANQTVTGGRPIACFLPRKPPEEQLRQIRFMDCYGGMARSILLGDDVMIPTRWTDSMIPFAWNAGSCCIVLDKTKPGPANLPKAEIAHYAAIMTKICVKNNEDPLGGQMTIGSRDQFTVTLWGRKWPEAG